MLTSETILKFCKKATNLGHIQEGQLEMIFQLLSFQLLSLPLKIKRSCSMYSDRIFMKKNI